VIEREFQHAEGAKTIGSSHGYFGLVVELLDLTAGKLLSGFARSMQPAANFTTSSFKLSAGLPVTHKCPGRGTF
jgi:hypothetical protein